jgi:hypothetical protein
MLKTNKFNVQNFDLFNEFIDLIERLIGTPFGIYIDESNGVVSLYAEDLKILNVRPVRETLCTIINKNRLRIPKGMYLNLFETDILLYIFALMYENKIINNFHCEINYDLFKGNGKYNQQFNFGDNEFIELYDEEDSESHDSQYKKGDE